MQRLPVHGYVVRSDYRLTVPPAPTAAESRRRHRVASASTTSASRSPTSTRRSRFYGATSAWRCVHEETNEEQGVREAMLAVGPTADGGWLQLLAPLTPDSTIAKFLDRNGPGMQQVAYTVADVEAVADALRARGVRLLYDEPRRGTAGSRVNFVHPKDAGGVLVELVEPAASPD